mmetsp:Transcript_1570/g.5404  ORF Transcript_1570/g.5404 Transcript_1570/m.5404 type:complete len:269 (-) Transcript_1570:4546-5352(-)
MLNALWTYLVENYPPIYYRFVFPYISMLLTFFIPTLLIAIFEISDWTPLWLKKLKIQQEKRVTPERVWNCFKTILIQYVFIIGPTYACGFSFIADLLGFSSGEVPAWYIVALQVLFCMVVEDFCQFVGHMALHHPMIFKYIHSWHHEYTAPFAMAGLYAHPAEVMILGFCSFVGPIILRPHFLTFFIWIHIKQAMTLHAHCGYEISYGLEKILPFKADVEYHDYHHKSFNGPYGTVFTCWDSMFGTDKNYQKHMATKELKKLKKQRSD